MLISTSRRRLIHPLDPEASSYTFCNNFIPMERGLRHPGKGNSTSAPFGMIELLYI